MIPVQKITITVTVFTQHQSAERAAELLSSMDLSDIAASIESGDCIGQVHIATVATVPAEKLKEELLAIGNDGLFFGSDGED